MLIFIENYVSRLPLTLVGRRFPSGAAGATTNKNIRRKSEMKSSSGQSEKDIEEGPSIQGIYHACRLVFSDIIQLADNGEDAVRDSKKEVQLNELGKYLVTKVSKIEARELDEVVYKLDLWRRCIYSEQLKNLQSKKIYNRLVYSAFLDLIRIRRSERLEEEVFSEFPSSGVQ